ncbi:DUF445 domain-containing protein [Chitinophagaceae bacterium LWZ2-11]
MHYKLIIIPIAAALIGWLINRFLITLLFRPFQAKKILGIHFQGFIPKKQAIIARQLGQYISNELFSFKDLEAKITNPENIEKLMPVVEEHIDNFLRVKLAEQMPMISMFIGDKTINQLKGVFTAELKNLFPIIMQNYMGNLQADLNLEEVIFQKIVSFPPDKIEAIFYKEMHHAVRIIKLAGAITGAIIGLLSLALLLFLN